MGISIGNSEISTATGIYCGSRKLRPDGGGEWKPLGNLTARYPLTQDSKDYSGNGNDLTQVGTITYSTEGAESTNLAESYLCNASPTGIPIGSSNRTYALWFNTSSNAVYPIGLGTSGKGNAFMINVRNASQWQLTTWMNDGGLISRSSGWNCHVITYNNGTWYWYINNNLAWSGAIGTNTQNGIGVFNGPSGGWAVSGTSCKVGYFAIIDGVWSSSEMTDYYNNTKSNYGL